MNATQCPNCQHHLTPRERTKVATVRMPASLYDRLQDKARELGESLNSLCVAALRREVAASRVEIKDGLIVIERLDGTAVQCHTLADAEAVLDQDELVAEAE